MPSSPSVIEAIDAPAAATTTYSLAVGQSAHGVLTLGDSDWYAVHLVAGHTYTIAEIGLNATTLRCQDTVLNLRSSTGAVVATNDDYVYDDANQVYSVNSILTFTATTSGTYYIDAGSFNGSDAGEYGISITEGTRASYDDAMGAGALLMGDASWSAAAGSGSVVTFGFRSTAGTGGGPNFSQCTTAEMAAIRSILSLWSDLCGITFQDVNPTGYTNNATILIGNYNDASDGAGAYAYFPGSTASSSSDGDIWLNLDSVDPNSIPVGSYSFFAIMHEMGHMLGLDHPGPYNAAAGVDITYANDAMFTEDSSQRTIMSYFGEGETGADFGPAGWADANTPMLYDILAAQQLYGANMNTRTGNTTYGFNANTDHDDIYDADLNALLAFCVWDAGGIDTFDFSGYSNNQTIRLGEATFSNVGGLVSNVSIAYGATIENAEGGSGADSIYGNAVANQLSGNNAADKLFGYAGADTLDGGNGNDYMVGGAGVDDISGGGGNDRFVVENTTDKAHEASGQGFDIVYARVNYTLGAHEEIEVLRAYNGSLNLQLTGNELANRIFGSTGTDTLAGGAGHDRLYGGMANDVLTGGTGNDMFLFDTALNASTNVDTITDFTNAAGNNDRFLLDDAIFAGIFNTGTTMDAALLAANAGGIATASSRIIYDTSTGALYYDQDGSAGAHARIQFATVSGHPALTSVDFMVY